MIVTFRNDQFVASCTYEERLAAKEAGFRWNAQARFWYTTDAGTAARLIDYADELVLSGVSIPTAALEAGKRRLRPIFLTASAAAAATLSASPGRKGTTASAIAAWAERWVSAASQTAPPAKIVKLPAAPAPSAAPNPRLERRHNSAISPVASG